MITAGRRAPPRTALLCLRKTAKVCVMYGRLISPHRLRALREAARLTPEELAARCGCHANHYRKLERVRDGRAVAEPSMKLGWRITAVLSDVLGEKVDLDDICEDYDPPHRVRSAA